MGGDTQGFQGDTGTQGFQGHSGFQGDTGAQGFQGHSGFQGDTGAPRRYGSTSFKDTGPQGFQGQGAQGPGVITASGGWQISYYPPSQFFKDIKPRHSALTNSPTIFLIHYEDCIQTDLSGVLLNAPEWSDVSGSDLSGNGILQNQYMIVKGFRSTRFSRT